MFTNAMASEIQQMREDLSKVCSGQEQISCAIKNEFASLAKMQSALQETLEEVLHAFAHWQSTETPKTRQSVETPMTPITPTVVFDARHEMSMSSMPSTVSSWNAAGKPEDLEQFAMDSITPDSDDSDEQTTEPLQWELHRRWSEPTVRKRRRQSVSNLSFDVFRSSVHADNNQTPGSLWLVPMQSYSFVSVNKDSLKKVYRSVCKSLKEFKLQRMVISPSSQVSLVWTLMEALLLTLDVFLVPMLVFEMPDTLFDQVFRVVSVVFWTCDMPVSFFKGYIKSNGEKELKVRNTAKHYLCRGFPLDILLLSIEWLNFLLWIFESGFGFEQAAKFLRVLRYLRSLKAGKLSILSRRLMARVQSAETVAVLRVFRQVIGIFMMCHIFACVWYAFGTLDKSRDDRWPVEHNARKEDRGDQFIYMLCLQWSLAQLGFGDTYIYPDNNMESAFAIVVALICALVMTMWLADIITSLIWIHDSRREQTKKKQMMQAYLQQKEVSFELQDRTWRVIKQMEKDMDKSVGEESVALIKTLPVMLELELQAEVFVRVLTRHPFFGTYGVSGADPYAMYNLIRKRATHSEALDCRQELFAEHDIAENMHFVVRGCVMYRFKYRCVEIQEQHWLGEPGLWLNWEHVGVAMATTPCSVVRLECKLFREVVSQDLPQAKKYARAFYLYAQRKGNRMNDVLPDVYTAGVMAQEAFMPPQTFELSKCQPVRNKYQNEWNPQDAQDWQMLWTSPWNSSHLASSSALILTMTTEMKRDAILLYQTMFSQNLQDQPFHWTSATEECLFNNRVLFLKRLTIFLAMGKVLFTHKDNSSDFFDFPYPLASLLCHGGRLLVRLHDVQPREFINLLLHGDGNAWNWGHGVPAPLYARMAGSHSVKVDATLQLTETRLRGASALSLSGRHLGMDLPVGGLGNPIPKRAAGNLKVGPAGVPFKYAGKKCVPSSAIQHGHLYIRCDDFGSRALRKLSLSDNTHLPGEHDPQATLACDFLSNLSRQLGFDGEETWTDVTRQIDTVEKLEALLFEGRCIEFASDKERLGQLYKYAIEESELTIEQNSQGNVRCRGVVVFLSIATQMDGSQLVLVHDGVLQGGELSSGAEGECFVSTDNGFIEDPRVAACLCKQHGLWLPKMMNYIQESFQLSDVAVERLFQGLAEEAHLTRTGPIPTISDHHEQICGQNVDVIYDALHLTTTISGKDSNFPDKFLGTIGTKVISKEKPLVDGPSRAAKKQVMRQWTWKKREDAQAQGICALGPPSNATPLKLLSQDTDVASMLIGIESSAPMKEDALSGSTHTASAKSNEFSAFGRRKWRDFRKGGLKVPADNGGVQILLTKKGFDEFAEHCNDLQLCVPSSASSVRDGISDEQVLFQRILQASANEAKDIFHNRHDLQKTPALERKVSLLRKLTFHAG